MKRRASAVNGFASENQSIAALITVPLLALHQIRVDREHSPRQQITMSSIEDMMFEVK
jgi:hypothetical protein